MEVLASSTAVITHYINVPKQLLYTLNLPYVICQLYLNDKKIMQAIACGRFWAFFLKLLINKNLSEGLVDWSLTLCPHLPKESRD